MFKLKTNKTLADILSGFYTAIDELEDLIERNDTQVGHNEHQIEILAHENRALNVESKRAEAIVEKLQSLIS